MRKTIVTICFLVSCLYVGSLAQTFGSDRLRSVEETADKVTEWQINHFTYRDSGNLHDYGIDAWTNGVLYLGMSRWASISKNGKCYHDWLYHEIGEKNNWQIPANFVNYPKYGIYHADELSIAQFYIEFYKKHQQREIILPTIARLREILNNPPDSAMSYRNKQSWTWCDALFMAPPVYLAVAVLESDPSYANFMHAQFKRTYNHLYDKDEHLFYRDDSYLGKREANGAKIFWGRGNGWVVAGLANILDLLPENDPQRPFYVDLMKTMIDRLIQLQHTDGYWRASLLDPESYSAPETSATALITYAIAYGINHEILDKKQYEKPLSQSWNFLLSVIDDEGKLGWVQPIGADPKSVTKDMTAVYGVGAFLMAASEVHDMERKYGKE